MNRTSTTPKFVRTRLGTTFQSPATLQNSTYTMLKKSTAFPADVEKQPTTDHESDTPLPFQQGQTRKTHKRLFLFMLAITFLLLAAWVLTCATYSFARLISAHTSQSDIVDQAIVSTDLYKRDELSGGQIFGIVAGVFVLLAFIVVSLWMFSCVVGGLERIGRPGH